MVWWLLKNVAEKKRKSSNLHGEVDFTMFIRRSPYMKAEDRLSAGGKPSINLFWCLSCWIVIGTGPILLDEIVINTAEMLKGFPPTRAGDNLNRYVSHLLYSRMSLYHAYIVTKYMVPFIPFTHKPRVTCTTVIWAVKKIICTSQRPRAWVAAVSVFLRIESLKQCVVVSPVWVFTGSVSSILYGCQHDTGSRNHTT